ncbi:uncharacterized protein DS421_4g118330 [Arachis hypogaea]|nr:uncharacterized protein DS421_4g118330 [Arachis hypogaea]
MTYHKENVHSYVKGCELNLNKDTISEALGYTNIGVDVYTSGKWDEDLCLSYQEALASIYVSISLIDGLTLNHKVLHPVRAQLHHIINHIILRQSGSYQRFSFCVILVLYAILMKIEFSFIYLMMRHMYDCIKSDKNLSLSYGIFLTCIFEYFSVNLSQ